MTTAKVENYSDELTQRIVSDFQAGRDAGRSTKEIVNDIAKAVGKTSRSIVAKLSREKVYVSDAKAKAGARVTKENLVARIAKLTGADEETLDSLEKATAGALKVVVQALEAREVEVE